MLTIFCDYRGIIHQEYIIKYTKINYGEDCNEDEKQ